MPGRSCAFCGSRFVRFGSDPYCGIQCRFSAKSVPVGDCLEWAGARDKDGYGITKLHRRAHRAAWAIRNGSIPSGMQVLHRCDNPPCVRVEHLFLGSSVDNRKDCAAKRRHPHGETHGCHVLMESNVREIRASYVRGSREFGYRGLALRYGVSRTLIYNIIRRLSWRHLD